MLNEITHKRLIVADLRFNFEIFNKKSIIQGIAIEFWKLWAWHEPITYGSKLFLLIIKRRSQIVAWIRITVNTIFKVKNRIIVTI